MFDIDWKKMRAYGLVIALAMGGTVALMPAQPVAAQARALPDFTDLVEQVGPSVVNIRTLERSRGAAADVLAHNVEQAAQSFVDTELRDDLAILVVRRAD